MEANLRHIKRKLNGPGLDCRLIASQRLIAVISALSGKVLTGLETTAVLDSTPNVGGGLQKCLSKFILPLSCVSAFSRWTCARGNCASREHGSSCRSSRFRF